MEIKFLGNWSSHLEKGKRNVSLLVDKHILLDCGPHTIESLFESGVNPDNLDRILISHMHLDHFGGLAEILWYRGSRNITDELTIMGPAGIRKNIERILQIYNTPDNELFKVTANYVEINHNGESYELKSRFVDKREDDLVEAFYGNHVIPDNMYRIEDRGCVIAYTGDTAYTENVSRAGEGADILFHEVTYTDNESKTAEFWKHSTYSSAIKGFMESKANKLAPVHLTEGTLSLLKSKNREDVILPISDIVLSEL